MPKEDLKDLEKEKFELIHEGWNGHWHITVYPKDSLWPTLNLDADLMQISKSEPKDSAKKSFELMDSLQECTKSVCSISCPSSSFN